jgi:hypothetical protein
VVPNRRESSIFATHSNFMTELYSPQQTEKLIILLNERLNCSVNATDYSEKSYSASSLADLLIQRYVDELTGEWTTEKAFAQLQSGLLKLGLKETDLHMDAKLNDLIPANGRRQKVQEWAKLSGIELDILKPNAVLNGLLTFLFFVFIPLGIGLDWFFSGIGMAVCAGGIYLLNKTASNFKTETLGQMAESVAWKLYLQQQKSDAKGLAQKVDEEVKRVMQMV